MDQVIANQSVTLQMRFAQEGNSSSIAVQNIDMYVIDKEHSNAYTKWQAMGRPAYPTYAELNVLRNASVTIAQDFSSYTVKHNVLTVSVLVRPYGTVLLDIDLDSSEVSFDCTG